MIPIWQRTYYTTTADTLTYSVKDTYNEEIFSGKAYKMPGESALTVNISEICAPFIGTNELPDEVFVNDSGSAALEDTVKTFNLWDSEGNLLSSYTFVDDWSYEPYSTVLSIPIDGKYAPGMKCLDTYLEDDYDSYAILDYSLDGYTIPACGKAALYYKTRRGGWCSFLIQGYVKRYDDYTWARYRAYLKGETTYLNEIQPRWELNTGWLNDEQSRNLAENLLSSPAVYLHLLEDDEVIPVTITNTNTEYKEYRRDKKRIAYQITATARTKKTRR